MKVSPERSTQLSWFLPLKLAQYVVHFAVVAFWLKYPLDIQAPFIVYSLLTLAFTGVLATRGAHRVNSLVVVAAGLQAICEIGIQALIIKMTGGLQSPFSVLMLLTIVSSALAFRLVGTLLIATAAALAYAVIGWAGTQVPRLDQGSLYLLKTFLSSHDSTFYSILIHTLIFYLVAFMSGFLAERLAEQDRRLADTSQALKRARLETDDILLHLNSGLLTVDASGCVIFFNRAAERILGYREEDVKGMPCLEVFSERMPALAEALLDGLSSGAEYPRLEIDIRDGQRRPLPLGVSTSILTDQDNKMRGIIAIFSDLTDAKALEAKVRSADRLAAIGELSASIAHEIRNPLAAISGSVEVLKRDLPVSGQEQQLMNLIVKESDRLTRILNDFLLYARIDRPSFNKVEICHLLHEVVEVVVRNKAYSQRIRLAVDSDESVAYVIGDDTMIGQIFINLLVNAFEAIGESEGKVSLRLHLDRPNEQVVVYVSDNGPGIEPETLRRMFEPFFSTKKEGTGLGLAIVHRLATAMAVDLSVDSTAGEGTTFVLRFPRYHLAAVTREAAVPAS